MPLLDLPNEILLSIAECLEYSWDVNSLVRVNHHTYKLLSAYLYRHDLQYTPISTLDCGATLGWDIIVRKLLDKKVLPREYDKHYLQKKMAAAAKNGHLQVLSLFMESWTRLHRLPFRRAPNILIYLGSALFQAVTSGHDTIALLLLDYGADPTVCPETWSCIADYPLGMAATCGRLPVLKGMIEMSRKTQYKNPVSLVHLLFYAVGGGHPNVIRYLIELGADPNTQKGGHYAIGSAAMRGGVEAVRCLLECGADPCPALPNGATLGPLCLAVSRGTINSAKLLLNRVNTDECLASDKELVPLLCCAAACGAEDLVRKLLRRGCDPDAAENLSPPRSFQFHGNRKPISWATRNGHEAVVRLLLDHGAKPNPILLDCAINSKSRSMSLITLLLDKGVDLQECHRGSSRPLLTALDEPVLFKLLLERGADPNHPVYRGLVMQHAIKRGGIPQVQMLLDCGLQLGIPPGTNHTDGTLLRFATLGGAPMLEFLFQHGYELSPDDKNDTFNIISLSISRHDIPALTFLVDRGVKLTTSKRYSPLFQSAVCTHETCEVIEPMLDLLLSRGLDIHAEDLSGRNCVWHALGYNGTMALTPYLEALLKGGACPLSRGNESTSPLYKATRKGLVGAVRAMLELGDFRDIPRSELKAELAMAKAEAIRNEKWKIVRSIERFWYGYGLHLI